ncbi:hypothetical protein BSKO_13391 [Bryopsis sp. KO-2023]|nr:hypothetical protein BSKO_13391 [Bryopsis sp. KO-2023]
MRRGGVVLKPVIRGGAKDPMLACQQDMELEVFSRLSSFLEDAINCHQEHLTTLEERGWVPGDVVDGEPLDLVCEVPFEARCIDIFSGADDTHSDVSTESSAICPLIPSMASSQDGPNHSSDMPSKLLPVAVHFPFPATQLFYGDSPSLPHTQEMLPTPEESPTKLQSLSRLDEGGSGHHEEFSEIEVQFLEGPDKKSKKTNKNNRKGLGRIARLINGLNRKMHK